MFIFSSADEYGENLYSMPVELVPKPSSGPPPYSPEGPPPYTQSEPLGSGMRDCKEEHEYENEGKQGRVENEIIIILFVLHLFFYFGFEILFIFVIFFYLALFCSSFSIFRIKNTYYLAIC